MAVGAPVLAWALVRAATGPLPSKDVAILVALAVVGEAVPLRVPFHGERQDVTLSTTFVFALLLIGQAPWALLAQAGGSAVSDISRRKPWWKTTFNVAQYSLSVAAAALVIRFLGGPFRTPSSFTPWILVVCLLSGVTLYVVNNVLIAIAIALSQRISLRVLLRNDMLFQAAVMLVLLSEAPLLILAVDQGLWLVPLFVPAVAVAYANGRSSIERDHRALHDALTELPNRQALHQHIAQLIATTPENPVAVFFVDLDGFREVNEALGHRMGDRLLVEVAARLRDELQETAYIARLGGDEFAGAVAVSDDALVTSLAGHVDEIIARPYLLDELPFRLRASTGVALAPRHGDSPELLLQRAEIAMYIAKERRSRFQIYTANIDRHDPRRLALIGELRGAIANGQLEVFYQPVATIENGEVVAAEALVRWNHPQHGYIQPDEFIPLAETTGDIDALTRFVASAALTECARWRDLGYDLGVAVNVSPGALQSELVDDLDHALRQVGTHPGVLTVEVTENGAMRDLEHTVHVLARLRGIGVTVALDDFGTGHASLAHLRRLPVDHIKIDKSFVLGMLTNEDDAAIVASTIELAHSLGLEVVAEGVESDAVWHSLQRRTCDGLRGITSAARYRRTRS